MTDRTPGVPARRVVVVGGGIAGLAAAHRLLRAAAGVEVTVLEGSPRLGGKLRVAEIGGLPVDAGAESMLARRPEAVGLAHEVGLADEVVPSATTSSGVWTRGAVRPLPPTVMGVPADLDAARDSGILSGPGLTRLAAERELPPLEPADAPRTADRSVGDLVAERLGEEVVDRLIEPLLGGVYAGHAHHLSLAAAAPQLAALVDRGPTLLDAARAVRGEADAAAGPVFAGLRGGVGRLAGAVAGRVSADPHGTIRTGAMVRELARTPDGWRLVVGPAAAPRAVHADAVILAVPALPASRLLSETVPAAAAALAEVPYASVALVTFAFRRGATTHRLRGSGFLVPPVDGRAVKAATFTSNKWQWVADADPGLVVVRTSLGRHREQQVLQRDDAELAALALADLRAATGLDEEPVDTLVQRWGGALPQYLVGHRDRVDLIRGQVARQPGLAVCGAAFDGLGIPACIRSAELAATQVLAGLAPEGQCGHE